MVRDYDPTNNYNNLLDRVIRHRDAIISHLNWVCIFLGFHSFGLNYSPSTVLLQNCFEKSLNMGKNEKPIFSVDPMPNAHSISQFIFQCSDNTGLNFFCFENLNRNKNGNDHNQTEISEPNSDSPILLYISKETFVKFPAFKNSKEITTTVRQTFNHSLIPLPFKYQKLTFDLYHRMSQLVSFETFRANLEKYKVPGVYCVESISTNFIYIGETNNLLNRFKRLPNELKDTKKQYHTSQFVQDWNQFGPDDFVFRIIHMGPEWANEKVRLERERQLVHENALKTYNNLKFYPFTPYKNVVLPSLKKIDEILFFPNRKDSPFSLKERKKAYENYEQPGIYVIVCFHATGGLFYFGETTNLLQRFSYIRSKLINSEKSSSTFWNKALLKCKENFGLKSFLFIPLYVGAEWENPQKRKKMETKLIRLNSLKALNVFKLNRQGEKNSIKKEEKQPIEKPI
jgi:predicted GIY-YIG superfamily endonuclease